MKKTLSLLVLLLIYVLAIALGVALFLALVPYMHFLFAILIADISATTLVYLTGLIFKTPSVYDPYWSVQTFIIYLGLLFYFNNWNIFTIIPLVTIGLYSVRLTLNFIIGFNSLKYVDWRYKMLKEKTGKIFQLVNYLGINMFPTLVVYLASVPLFVFASLSFDSYSYFSLIGSGIILLGTLLELIADIEMKKFIKVRKSRSEIINIGLWKYSRHPNYLGEILIWFGVALILLIPHIEYAYWISGALVNLIMFLVISIPMEEKHMMEYKPGMLDYKKTTSMLLILPKRKLK